MLVQVIAVKDNAVNAFTSPVSLPHVGAAVREFSANCNEPTHEFCKHAGDYDLFHLGTFDNETGIFTNFPDGPQRLVRGVDVKSSGH